MTTRVKITKGAHKGLWGVLQDTYPVQVAEDDFSLHVKVLTKYGVIRLEFEDVRLFDDPQELARVEAAAERRDEERYF